MSSEFPKMQLMEIMPAECRPLHESVSFGLLLGNNTLWIFHSEIEVRILTDIRDFRFLLPIMQIFVDRESSIRGVTFHKCEAISTKRHGTTLNFAPF